MSTKYLPTPKFEDTDLRVCLDALCPTPEHHQALEQATCEVHRYGIAWGRSRIARDAHPENPLRMPQPFHRHVSQRFPYDHPAWGQRVKTHDDTRVWWGTYCKHVRVALRETMPPQGGCYVLTRADAAFSPNWLALPSPDGWRELLTDRTIPDENLAVVGYASYYLNVNRSYLPQPFGAVQVNQVRALAETLEERWDRMADSDSARLPEDERFFDMERTLWVDSDERLQRQARELLQLWVWAKRSKRSQAWDYLCGGVSAVQRLLNTTLGIALDELASTLAYDAPWSTVSARVTRRWGHAFSSGDDPTLTTLRAGFVLMRGTDGRVYIVPSEVMGQGWAQFERCVSRADVPPSASLRGLSGSMNAAMDEHMSRTQLLLQLRARAVYGVTHGGLWSLRKAQTNLTCPLRRRIVELYHEQHTNSRLLDLAGGLNPCGEVVLSPPTPLALQPGDVLESTRSVYGPSWFQRAYAAGERPVPDVHHLAYDFARAQRERVAMEMAAAEMEAFTLAMRNSSTGERVRGIAADRIFVDEAQFAEMCQADSPIDTRETRERLTVDALSRQRDQIDAHWCTFYGAGANTLSDQLVSPPPGLARQITKHPSSTEPNFDTALEHMRDQIHALGAQTAQLVSALKGADAREYKHPTVNPKPGRHKRSNQRGGRPTGKKR